MCISFLSYNIRTQGGLFWRESILNDPEFCFVFRDFLTSRKVGFECSVVVSVSQFIILVVFDLSVII